MSRGPDAGARLERALIAMARNMGIDARVTAADWTRWASATFVGARHRLTLNAAPSATLDAWVTGLPEREFDLTGHLVADLAVTSTRRAGDMTEIAIEALTVEER